MPATYRRKVSLKYRTLQVLNSSTGENIKMSKLNPQVSFDEYYDSQISKL